MWPIGCKGEWRTQLMRRSMVAHVSGTQQADLFLGVLQLQREVLLQDIRQLSNGDPDPAEAGRPG